MNNRFRLLIIIVLITFITAILCIYVILPLFKLYNNTYKMVEDYKRFMWLLNDNDKLKSINGDPKLAVWGSERKWDQYFNYNLEGGLYIHIFEFMDLEPINVDAITFNYCKYKDNLIVDNGFVVNKDLQYFPIITIKYKTNFKNKLRVNFDTVNNLEIIRDTLNCKTFFGQLNNMSLSNFENEQLVFFDFSKKKETLITFYTKDSRFFLILITSKYELNKDCINLLKLK